MPRLKPRNQIAATPCRVDFTQQLILANSKCNQTPLKQRDSTPGTWQTKIWHSTERPEMIWLPC